MLRSGASTTSKQKEMADILAVYYKEKIVNLNNHLPKVNIDPLWALKRAHEH